MFFFDSEKDVMHLNFKKVILENYLIILDMIELILKQNKIFYIKVSEMKNRFIEIIKFLFRFNVVIINSRLNKSG